MIKGISSLIRLAKVTLAVIATSIFLTATSMTPIPDGPVPGKGVIYLNFNGYKRADSAEVFAKQSWAPSNLPDSSKLAIQVQVMTYFSDWQVILTSDPSMFYSYPQDHRIQVIISSDSLARQDIFGYIYLAGGISYLNSLLTKDSTPALVSIPALFSNKNIAIATAHEIGHMLGLAHQSEYDQSFNKTEEYNSGDPFTAPIMGRAYFAKEAVWYKGFNTIRMWQDDKEIISKTFLSKPKHH